MASESIKATTELPNHKRIVTEMGTTGTGFILAATLFFVGSSILTQSGQPGASTPRPWMLSHALWVVAMAFVALDSARLVLNIPKIRAGLGGYVASGLVGLGVLHTLQWTTWVYVDVIAYQQGTHAILLPALFHPFGTGHMLMFAIIIGSAITSLAWALTQSNLTHWIIPWIGVLVGIVTIFAGLASLVTFAAVRSPTSLLAIISIAISFAWLFVLGVALYRNRRMPDPRAAAS